MLGLVLALRPNIVETSMFIDTGECIGCKKDRLFDDVLLYDVCWCNQRDFQFRGARDRGNDVMLSVVTIVGLCCECPISSSVVQMGTASLHP
jgi:hypothetical protein